MGGRRRSSNKPLPKRKPKIEKVFKCPVCSHGGATVTITKQDNRPEAIIECKVCKSKHKFSRTVTFLTEPIDVYSDWLDARDREKKRTVVKQRDSGISPDSRRKTTSSSKSSRSRAADDDEEEQEDVLDAPGLRKKSKNMEEDDEEEEEEEEVEEEGENGEEQEQDDGSSPEDNDDEDGDEEEED